MLDRSRAWRSFWWRSVNHAATWGKSVGDHLLAVLSYAALGGITFVAYKGGRVQGRWILPVVVTATMVALLQGAYLTWKEDTAELQRQREARLRSVLSVGQSEQLAALIQRGKILAIQTKKAGLLIDPSVSRSLRDWTRSVETALQPWPDHVAAFQDEPSTLKIGPGDVEYKVEILEEISDQLNGR